MGRKNRRVETFVPLDLTPEPEYVGPPPPNPPGETREQARERRDRKRTELIRRQREAAINRGIDWSVCLVPGCGESLVIYGQPVHGRPGWRDATVALPLCLDHLAIARNQYDAEVRTDPTLHVEVVAKLSERRQAKGESLHEAAKKAWLTKTDGDIYYIRLNGLIKVGWSRDFYQRLKSYGPDAEVLVLYRATRDDETNLHRQLRPARAKGREWYHDGPILNDFIARALAQHGEPRITTYNWTQPNPVVAGKRIKRPA